MKNTFIISAAVVAGFLLATSAQAQILVSTSSLAPTPGANDIYQLTSDGSVTNSGATAVWSDKGGQGQSFTTLGAAADYQLNSITIDANGTGGNGSAGPLILAIGTYSGGLLTATNTYTAASTTNLSSINNNLGNNLYITFTLSTPITLSASTSYGFAVGSTGAGLLLAQNTSATYLGGTAFTTSPTNGLNAPITGGSANAFNRVFDVSLTPTESAPEPSTWALMLGGVVTLGLISRRRAIRRS